MALLSMTGYGKATVQGDLGTFAIEIRSVNSRYFDFNARLPREWTPVEIRLRELVHERISRGKVDLVARWTPPPELSLDVELSEKMIGAFAQRFRQAGESLGESIGIPWAELFRIPGVLTIRPPDVDMDALFEAVRAPVVEALDQLETMRAAEGQAMAEALADHVGKMEELTDAVERERGCVLEKQRERLGRLVEQMRQNVGQALSEDRLEAEILLWADRSEITEEIVRLRSHCEAFRQLLSGPDGEPSGKRMEFIAQEMLRETNTIGSKARDTAISASVVSLKHEVEKIREQLQNVE